MKHAKGKPQGSEGSETKRKRERQRERERDRERERGRENEENAKIAKGSGQSLGRTAVLLHPPKVFIFQSHSKMRMPYGHTGD